MGSIMIRCPATGTAIPTGIQADRSSFARTPVFMARAHCPICKAEHEWFAREAWVREDLDEANSAAAWRLRHLTQAAAHSADRQA